MEKFSSEEISDAINQIVELVDISSFARYLEVSVDVAQREFDDSLGEARQTLSLLEDLELEKNASVLEVGTGLGVACCALSILGFAVAGIEPGGIGFESNQKSSLYIAQSMGLPVSILNETAEKISFVNGEQFDLIYSNNVLEHIDNFEASLKNLLSYLSPTGVMIHSCPNYAFPFEPHFGIPLVPFFPHLTTLILPRSISRSGLWKSLNFVSVRQVKRVLRKSDYSVKFKRGRMVKSFSRLNEDTQFQSRHKILGKIAQNRFIFWLLKRLLNLPNWIATPMDFIVVHRSMSEDPKVLSWLAS